MLGHFHCCIVLGCAVLCCAMLCSTLAQYSIAHADEVWHPNEVSEDFEIIMGTRKKLELTGRGSGRKQELREGLGIELCDLASMRRHEKR